MWSRISFTLKENGAQTRVPRLVYLIEICHLWLLYASWWRFTCKNIAHFSVSHRLYVDMLHVEGMFSSCLLTKSRIVAFPRLVYIWQADRWRVWIISIMPVRTGAMQMYRVVGTPSQRPYKQVTWVWISIPETNRGNSVRIIHLVSCTMSNYCCFVKHTSQGKEAYLYRFLEHDFVDFKFSLFVVHLMMLTHSLP